MKRILIVSPYFPYPANFGGAYDILQKIIYLKNKGHHVSVLATIKNDIPIADYNSFHNIVDELIISKRNSYIKSVLSRNPFQVESRIDLKNIVLETKYDIIILEGEYVGGILDNKFLDLNTKIILRIHNNESRYFFELFKSKPLSLSSLYYFIEAIKFKFYNKKLYSKINHYRCVSLSESELLSKRYILKDVKFTPIIIDCQSFKTQDLQNRKLVLYVGSLIVPNNIQSIKWYLKNVHPYLKDVEGYFFQIVGSVKSSKIKKWLMDIAKDDLNVNVKFNAEDLSEYYSKAAVFVNPVFSGAGVKIKNIDSTIRGIPVITTPKGNDGIGFTDNKEVVICYAGKDFVHNIKKILNDSLFSKNIVDAAQAYLKKVYNPNENIQDFL